MGKKKKEGTNLGKALIRDRFGVMKGKKLVENNSMLHTTEMQDGYDWGRLNLQSVTEESSFQEFLSTAELAGTEFQGEKLNIKFVGSRKTVGILSHDETKKMKQEHEQNKECLKIPRRPLWNSQTTPEELQRLERENFLEWRRSLAELQENQNLLLTPFEKNLEFWRQLWRVVERSDIIVQIVDARNPLLFRCQDLEKYVKEVSEGKLNLILINKSDFLTETQRQIWADYFSQENMRVAFFSALETEEKTVEETSEEDKDLIETADPSADIADKKEDVIQEVAQNISKLDEAVNEIAEKLKNIQSEMSSVLKDNKLDEVKEHTDIKNSADLLTRDQLISFFRSIHKGPKVLKNITTVGLVGYPNVGKSSTINNLMSAKKVSVSATPGKTKHFQTLYLDNDLLLCDCPGLVMPSFVFTKSEMIINGILPIDQMKDHVGPVNLVSSLIPRHVFEGKYGIMLPVNEDDEEKEPPTAEELLNAYGYNRGFMTANGQPDNPRSSRYILKDFVNGKLLYCHAPPTIDQKEYHMFPEASVGHSRPLPPKELRAIKLNRVTSEDVDNSFFRTDSKGVHVRGLVRKMGPSSETNSSTSVEGKPWKQINKYTNKKKREKLRRVYAHLDQH